MEHSLGYDEDVLFRSTSDGKNTRPLVHPLEAVRKRGPEWYERDEFAASAGRIRALGAKFRALIGR
jgi:hypothetical protein